MAIGTLTGAAIAAGVGKVVGKVAESVGPAYLGSRAQNNATRAQEKARQEALNYERQRLADDQRRRDQQAAAYREAWLAWYQRNGEEGVRRYGVPVGIQIPGAAKTQGPAIRMTGSTVAPAPRPAAPVAPPVAGPVAAPLPGATVGDLMGGTTPPPAVPPTPQVGTQQPPQGATLGSMSGWEDWNRYA